MDEGRTRRHLGAAIVTVGVLSAGGLIACTDDGTPGPTGTTTNPTASTAGSGSAPGTPPTGTETPPPPPKNAPTPKNAEAFVRYFWEVHNFAYQNLTVVDFKSISDSECTFCFSTIKDIEALRQAGSRAEGARIRLTVVAAPPVKITTGIIVEAVISQDAGRIIRRDGTERDVPAMRESQAHISLNWLGQRWVVADVAVEKPGQSS